MLLPSTTNWSKGPTRGQTVVAVLVACLIQTRLAAQSTPPLDDLLIDGAAVDLLFLKVLSRSDDSGRNGVQMPQAAWSIFPRLRGDKEPTTNGSHPITTVWGRTGQTRTQPSIWRRGRASNERYLTALGSKRLNEKPPFSVFVLARYRDRSRGYEAHVLYPGDRLYSKTLDWFGVTDPVTRDLFSLVRDVHRGHSAKRTTALSEFLRKFDVIKSRGYVKTLRSGSTGIGYTLETMLGLDENNDPAGDFQGMELKAYRDSEATLDDTEKMNLFLKEPQWLDGLKSAERISKYGYVDKNGRTAMYSTVTIRENSHGLRFELDLPNRKLFLLFKGERVAVWSFAVLQRRLSEKHTEAAFIAARTRGNGAAEQFHYHAVTWCSRPSVESLVELIKTRDVMLELRMHVKENGSARNHGTAFRVHKNKLPELYAITVRCR